MKAKVNTKGTKRKNSASQTLQRSKMAVIGHFARLVNQDIKSNFKQTQFGYELNGFMKNNYAHLSVAFTSLINDVASGAIVAKTINFTTLNNAIIAYVASHPDSIVYNDKNETVVYVGSTGWPTPPVPLLVSGFTIQGTPVTSLPKTVSGASTYVFTGVSLEASRLRVTVASVTHLLTDTTFFEMTKDTLTEVIVRDLFTPLSPTYSVTSIQYLNEEGSWLSIF
jgi:hypothetical protein